jgi:orotidine-5'-phosphate decarboxylase
LKGIKMTSPVFCSFDTPSLDQCLAWHEALGAITQPKVGLEFFMAQGPAGVQRVVGQAGAGRLFLDLKLHDIPNTVAGALRSLLPLQAGFITIHTSGGSAMMQAARDVAASAGMARPKLLGVTALTSLDAADLAAVGQDADSAAQVVRLARLAQQAGLDGVICAPTEIAALRAACGQDFILMVPGIRPTWADANDQKRVLTPRQAIDAGATYLVIGRPITAAADPLAAAQRINAELVV